MPCYRCGARQSDPARGSRLWVRAVRFDEQVLVCPECQQTHGWSTDLDQCPTCGSTTLVRRLGQTVCRACEASATAEFLAVESTIDTGAGHRHRGGSGGRHRRDDGRDLSTEVASAIAKILGQADGELPRPRHAGAERPAEDAHDGQPPASGVS
ncbi:MAG TPA: hypothetical protein VIP77_07500 [Jiangellaceae bacterium]